MLAGRRKLAGLVAAATATLAFVGVQMAAAQQDGPPTGTDDTALLERLDALEVQLPVDLPPSVVEVDEDASWGAFEGDFGSTRAILDTLEPDLRRLFVEADDADTPVADAVAEVSRGWLELREAVRHLAAYEAHDLEYPVDASDDDAVALDADELRGDAQVGLRLLLSARARHLDGYRALQELGAAEPEAQARLDARALDAETFDAEVRPPVLQLFGVPGTQLTVPHERFSSTAPGSEARARSMTVTCVDRDTWNDFLAGIDPSSIQDGSAFDEVLEELLVAPIEREDCPALPPNVEVRPAG